jgi:head-tail adaptor
MLLQRLPATRAERSLLQRKIETSTARGNLVSAWTVESKPYIWRTPLRGVELYEAQQVRPTLTHKVRLRRCVIGAGWRFLIYGQRWSLSGTINAEQTVIQATKPTGSPDIYPPKLPFYLHVAHELMLVTSISGSNWTVQRGADGTTAANHGQGVDVFDMRVLDIDSILDGGATHHLECLVSENNAR